MARDRVLYSFLGVSALFHLSMVTVFQIVIFFPQDNIDYYSFEIVDPRVERVRLDPDRELLSMPSPDSALERMESLENSREPDGWSNLPAVRLPTLEFAELDRLSMRVEGLKVRSRYQELFQGEPDDAWARFGKGLSSMSQALARVALGADTPEETASVPISRPAPGYEAYLDWITEPRDRQPISVSKIEALWGLDPAQFPDPITLVFKVNRAGRVVEVLQPMEDEEGLVESAIRALLQFRFEALDDDGPRTQHATLTITAAGDLE